MVANNSSAVDIANFALGKLGQGSIVNLTDASEKAIIMNLFYEHTRQACLNEFNWQFARKRVSLASITQVPAFEYSYQYELPNDFLRLVQVDIYQPPYNYSTVIGGNSKLYEIENNKILTNLEAPLKIIYTADIVDTTQFTPLFVQYLSTRLAIDACEQLTQSNTKKDALLVEAKQILVKTAMADRSQSPPQQLVTGAFVDSRVL